MKDQSENNVPVASSSEATQVPVQAQVVPPYATPVAGQQVQYVNIVNQKSLEGLGGWLLLWLISFALNGLFYIIFFFGLIASPDSMKTEFGVVSMLFIPFLTAGYISSAVFIAMRKKLAVITSIATFGVLALYTSILMIISATKADAPASSMIPMTIGIVLTIVVTNGLFALYFFVSKRVKATLTN